MPRDTSRIEPIAYNNSGDLMRYSCYIWEYNEAKQIFQQINKALPLSRKPAEQKETPVILLTLMNPGRAYYKLYPDGTLEQKAAAGPKYYSVGSALYTALFNRYWPEP